MSNQNSNPPRNASANNKMLIDATHPEETRVVVQRNGRVEEFDFESAARKLLRGNIYLAKVTRVEPSLQAAFVDYGGNRHGFLAFNEIHPDYYQIPVADRRALIEAETAAEAEEEAAADRAAEAAARRARRRAGPEQPSHMDDAEDHAIDVTPLMPLERDDDGRDADDEGQSATSPAEAHHEAEQDRDHATGEDREAQRSMSERSERDPAVHSTAVELDARSARDESDTSDRQEAVDHRAAEGDQGGDASRSEDRGPASDAEASTDHGHHHDNDDHHHDRDERDAGDRRGGEDTVETVDTIDTIETIESGSSAEAEQIETVSVSEDVLEEVPTRPRRRLRSYKIQEVTKRRQVLLIQVVKEERGTKGAALTTYLSLAGRYTVLMPNTARGGGISRKITNPQDRKRLKAIAAELDVPEGMGLIIRTAGAARTKQEIKRDYEYLLRLWESVRELALGSNAPALVYEEGNLIKRSIRDLYGKEVEEIVVAGDAAYREAKDFMRMLMPSHAKNVIQYSDPEPLFTRYNMERQLNAMFSPYVHLRSGGYLVINQTEALVAIDINSGKSTREFSIEETAYSTNMEAADEIARQLKLRDLAGLIVIDFIDMEEKRNNRAVERRLKDALRHDRARIQLGRISHFGLLEMSRQRMRTGVLEGSTTQCPHCQGTGIIRSTESVALAVLRGLEDALLNGQPASLTATTAASVALYILNGKRSFIVEMENRYGITIQIQASEKMQGANFTVERQARREEVQRRHERTAVNMDWGFEDEEQDAAAAEPVEDDGDHSHGHSQGSGDSETGTGSGDGRRRRRRRRGRRGDNEGSGEARAQNGRRSAESADTSGGGRSEVEELDEEEATTADAERYADNGNGHDEHEVVEAGADAGADDADADGDGTAARHGDGEQDGEGERRRRRRRGRRGGRRNNQERDRPQVDAGTGEERPASYHSVTDGDEHAVAADAGGPDVASESDTEAQPRRRQERATREPERVSEAEPAHVEQPSQEPASQEPAHANGHDKPAATYAGAEVAAEPEPTPAPSFVPAEVLEVLEPAPVPAPAPVPVATARSAPVASEPVLERVVVGPQSSNVAAQAEESARPARRGWWQRK